MSSFVGSFVELESEDRRSYTLLFKDNKSGESNTHHKTISSGLFDNVH